MTTTVEEARRYLQEENGWTPAEFDAFLATMAPWDYPTSTDAWTAAATAHTRREAEARWPMGHDVAPCLDAGDHVPSTRHTKALCPVLHEEDLDPDEDGQKALMRYLEGGWPGADQYRAEEEQDRQRAEWGL